MMHLLFYDGWRANAGLIMVGSHLGSRHTHL
jgi:hypothetical protein